MTKYVQFESENQERVVSEFCGPQDSEANNFLGEVDEDDPRYAEYAAAIQPLM